MTSTREHKLASIAADAGTAKQIVQHWLRMPTSGELCEINKLIRNTRYFRRSKKDSLLQYQSQRNKAKKTLETAQAGLTPEHGGIAPQTQSNRGRILIVVPCKLFPLRWLRLIFHSWRNDGLGQEQKINKALKLPS